MDTINVVTTCNNSWEEQLRCFETRGWGGCFISLLKTCICIYIYIRARTNIRVRCGIFLPVINGKNIPQIYAFVRGEYESGDRDLRQPCPKFIYKLSFVHLHNENASRCH